MSELNLNFRYITNDRNLAGRVWHGDYAEILAFSTALTESQIIEVEDFIKCRYGNKVVFEEDVVLGVNDPCDNIPVTAPNEFDTYLWSTGDETPATTLNGMGKYWLEGSSSFNYITSDTLEVRFEANIIDTENILCLGDELPWNLNIHSDFEVEWSDGVTGSSRGITEEGTYFADITNTQGCTWRTPSVSVTVDDYPSMTEIQVEDNFCLGNEIFLGQGFEESLTYLWSTDQTSAFITPPEEGEYWVETTNINGCIARDTANVELVGVAPAVEVGIPLLCQNEEVTITDSTIPVDAEILEWNWSIGNQNATTQDVSTVFTQANLTPLSLTVTLNNGCTGTLRDTLDIRPQPVVNFSAPVVCAGSEVFFEDLSNVPQGGSIATQNWTFGNGTQDDGVVGTTVFETMGASTVNLAVVSNEGCTNELTRNIEVLGSPDADFEAEDVCSGVSVVLSEDVDTSESGPVFYNWQFGDGFFSNFPNTSHNYAAPGSYNVTLTATGNNVGQQGCVSSITKTVRVFPPPTAEATAFDVCLGTPTTLTDVTQPTQLNGMPDPVVSHTWMVNGNPAGNAEIQTFTPNAGTTSYTALLEVTTEAGCTDEATATFSALPIPEASFTLDIPEASPPFTAVPVNASTDAQGYVWLIDGETVSNEAEPELAFAEAGTYQVALAATNSIGCNDTATVSAVVIDPAYHLSLLGIETTEVGGHLEIGAVLRNRGNVPVRNFDIRVIIGQDVNYLSKAEFTIPPGTTLLYPLNADFALTPGRTLPYTCLEVGNPNGINDLDPPAFELDTTDNRMCTALDRPRPTFAPPYPNPTSDAFSLGVILPEAAVLRLTMIDASGREVRSATWNLDSGFNLIDWPVNDLMGGVYLLKYDVNGELHTERVVVAR